MKIMSNIAPFFPIGSHIVIIDVPHKNRLHLANSTEVAINRYSSANRHLNQQSIKEVNGVLPYWK